MRALWECGESALPALEAAADSPNPEIAARAKLLLGRIRLGVGPDAPASLVRLVVQAREAPAASERSQARLRLAAVQSGAAPAIARILAEALAPGAQPADAPEMIIAELWPADPWALARVNDELSRIGDGRILLEWLERAAAQNVSAWAAPSFAIAARSRADLEGAVARWRTRTEAEPSPENRRVLACLLFASDDPAAAESLPSGPAAHLLPVAWALIGGDHETAKARAAAHPDELTRHALELLLARASGDQKTEFAASVQIRQWLKDNGEALVRTLREPPQEVQPGVIPAPISQALRAMLAALLAGELPACFALADEIDAPGLVRVHYRRLEFELGAQLVARHTQRQGDQTREVQVSQRRMRQELETQTRRGPPPVLSSYAARRIAALDAAMRGDWPAASETFAGLVETDDSDPAVRWAWGRALVESGQAERGQEQLSRALSMPLANPWVTRALAGEMLLFGEHDLALAQLQESARWSGFVPAESLAVLETLAEYSAQARQHQQSACVLAAAMILLMNEEVYAQLGDRALYFAFFLAAELERARMNESAGAGDWPEAQASLARSLAYLPQTEAAIDLISALDAAGHAELADRIFIEAFTPISNAVARYPQSSLLCNQGAWLAASCSRRLDSALHLAQSAVNFDPSSPAAIDTLAEVYFRRGQPQRALELLERTLALAEAQDSVGTYQSSQLLNYLKRRREFLERIEAGDAAD